MKKSFVLLFAIIACISVSAQTSKAKVGLVSGVTISNMNGTVGGVDVDYKSYVGYTVGMVVDAPFKKGHFSFQPGLHYTQKGAQTFDVKNQEDYIALRYADLSLNLVYNTHGDKGGSFYFGAGPQIGANLPSKKVTVLLPSEVKTESNIAFGNEAASDFRGIDWGANIIAGYTLKCGATFALNYNFGIRNLVPEARNAVDELRNGQLGIRVGYFFK
jgi:hypothetical protein